MHAAVRVAPVVVEVVALAEADGRRGERAAEGQHAGIAADDGYHVHLRHAADLVPQHLVHGRGADGGGQRLRVRGGGGFDLAADAVEDQAGRRHALRRVFRQQQRQVGQVLFPVIDGFAVQHHAGDDDAQRQQAHQHQADDGRRGARPVVVHQAQDGLARVHACAPVYSRMLRRTSCSTAPISAAVSASHSGAATP
ncbi:hypothetical protein D3C87_1195330 [compost metagenome]